jgi:hypothetical protein
MEAEIRLNSRDAAAELCLLSAAPLITPLSLAAANSGTTVRASVLQPPTASGRAPMLTIVWRDGGRSPALVEGSA